MTARTRRTPLRSRLRVVAYLAAAFSFLVLAGCRTTPAEVAVPDGFAAYTDTDLFTVVSPESVSLRVKTADNRPVQSLEFWSEALKVSLSRGGYHLLDEGRFEASVGEGRFLEWAAPVGEEDWIYLTAIAVTADHIVIVEAAGSYEHFTRHRAAILKSLQTLRIR